MTPPPAAFSPNRRTVTGLWRPSWAGQRAPRVEIDGWCTSIGLPEPSRRYQCAPIWRNWWSFADFGSVLNCFQCGSVQGLLNRNRPYSFSFGFRARSPQNKETLHTRERRCPDRSGWTRCAVRTARHCRLRPRHCRHRPR